MSLSLLINLMHPCWIKVLYGLNHSYILNHTYISLLIIACMIVYVTNNKEPWTLKNLDSFERFSNTNTMQYKAIQWKYHYKGTNLFFSWTKAVVWLQKTSAQVNCHLKSVHPFFNGRKTAVRTLSHTSPFVFHRRKSDGMIKESIWERYMMTVFHF